MALQSFIIGRIKSFSYAYKGAFLLLTTEHSAIVQGLAAVVVTTLGFVFNISAVEWMLQTLAIGLVLGMEGLNTAVEKTADFIHPEYDDKIGRIKDIAAGAVFCSAVCAFAIGCIIYVPRFIELLDL